MQEVHALELSASSNLKIHPLQRRKKNKTNKFNKLFKLFKKALQTVNYTNISLYLFCFRTSGYGFLLRCDKKCRYKAIMSRGYFIILKRSRRRQRKRKSVCPLVLFAARAHRQTQQTRGAAKKTHYTPTRPPHFVAPAAETAKEAKNINTPEGGKPRLTNRIITLFVRRNNRKSRIYLQTLPHPHTNQHHICVVDTLRLSTRPARSALS